MSDDLMDRFDDVEESVTDSRQRETKKNQAVTRLGHEASIQYISLESFRRS